MERTMEILNQYEQGNFFERMCLFLHYRDQRDAFQEIKFKATDANGTSLSSSEIQTIRFQFDENIETDLKRKGGSLWTR